MVSDSDKLAGGIGQEVLVLDRAVVDSGLKFKLENGKPLEVQKSDYTEFFRKIVRLISENHKHLFSF